MDRIDKFAVSYDFLSNFYQYDEFGRSLENYFQAAKTTDPEMHYRILNSPTPSLAKKLGRKCKLNPNWESIKEQVMRDLIARKFALFSPLAQRLIATGDAYLEEGNDWGDRYWGTVNGDGLNRLGVILMERRAFLKEVMNG